MADTIPEENEILPVKRKRGRPKGSTLQANKKYGKVGRPKGEASIMQDYKARMLASPKSKKVINAIFEAALDNEHKNQAAAWKLLMDRMLPVSMFEKEVDSGAGSKPTINITIGTVGTEIRDVISGEVIDQDE